MFFKLFFGKVGKHCYMASPTFLFNERRIFINDKVRLFPGYRMEVHNDGKINIGSNVSIGQNFHMISSKNSLNIGDNCLISANVFISNCDHSFKNNRLIEKETIISSGCFIGYGAVILPGTILGRNCVVGANSVVKGVFPDNAIVVGAPGRIVNKLKFND